MYFAYLLLQRQKNKGRVNHVPNARLRQQENRDALSTGSPQTAVMTRAGQTKGRSVIQVPQVSARAQEHGPSSMALPRALAGN